MSAIILTQGQSNFNHSAEWQEAVCPAQFCSVDKSPSGPTLNPVELRNYSLRATKLLLFSSRYVRVFGRTVATHLLNSFPHSQTELIWTSRFDVRII